MSQCRGSRAVISWGVLLLGDKDKPQGTQCGERHTAGNPQGLPPVWAVDDTAKRDDNGIGSGKVDKKL